MNSIKQTKKAIYPVRVGSLLGVEREGLEEEKEEMQGDVLWCTEMERCVLDSYPYVCVYCCPNCVTNFHSKDIIA